MVLMLKIVNALTHTHTQVVEHMHTHTHTRTPCLKRCGRGGSERKTKCPQILRPHLKSEYVWDFKINKIPGKRMLKQTFNLSQGGKNTKPKALVFQHVLVVDHMHTCEHFGISVN